MTDSSYQSESPFDPSLQRVQTIASAELVPVAKNTQSELHALIWREVPAMEGDPGRLNVDVALPYLERCRLVIERELLRLARPHSAVKWLWYLRRLPRLHFANVDIHLDVEALRLATIACGLSTTQSDFDPQFEPTDCAAERRMVRQAIRLCHTTSTLLRIQKSIGLAGYGIDSFGLARGEPIPEPILSPSVIEAISLYNERGHNSADFLNRLGTRVAFQQGSDDFSDNFLIVNPAANDGTDTLIVPPVEGYGRPMCVMNNYQLRIVSLNQLAQLNADPRLKDTVWYQLEAAAILVLLRLVPILALHTHRLDALLVLGQSYGYYVQRESVFHSLVNHTIAAQGDIVRQILPSIHVPSNADELLTLLGRCQGEIWPPVPGPIILRAHDHLYIDLDAATARLESLLEYPRNTDEVAKARSYHFELVVQQVIDGSDWRPPRHVRELRGKELKVAGKAITEIDAVGAKGKTLLIVSCKSMLYSTRHHSQ